LYVSALAKKNKIKLKNKTTFYSNYLTELYIQEQYNFDEDTEQAIELINSSLQQLDELDDSDENHDDYAGDSV